jgi:hypothetical protein
MFKTLYELLTGQNADPTYSTDVFPTVGLFTLAFTLVIALIFYVLLGRWRPVWEKTGHWLVTLLLISATSGFVALGMAKSATGEEANAYMYSFSMINALYSVVYFFVFSLLLKRTSIFAKRTPF